MVINFLGFKYEDLNVSEVKMVYVDKIYREVEN